MLVREERILSSVGGAQREGGRLPERSVASASSLRKEEEAVSKREGGRVPDTRDWSSCSRSSCAVLSKTAAGRVPETDDCSRSSCTSWVRCLKEGGMVPEMAVSSTSSLRRPTSAKDDIFFLNCEPTRAASPSSGGSVPDRAERSRSRNSSEKREAAAVAGKVPEMEVRRRSSWRSRGSLKWWGTVPEMRVFSSSIFWSSVRDEVSSAGRVPETAVSSSDREAKLADSRFSSGGRVPLRPSLPSASMAMRRESEASERGSVPSSRLPCRLSPITSPPPPAATSFEHVTPHQRHTSPPVVQLVAYRHLPSAPPAEAYSSSSACRGLSDQKGGGGGGGGEDGGGGDAAG
mmetsp:Transcript_46017/g.141946  ORF Transcript_46017/g.141946 Transcript_46017/m.141946 type:complete len:347 (-) Transcript_46017:189-1229(-)